jgi:hypothetical protein
MKQISRRSLFSLSAGAVTAALVAAFTKLIASDRVPVTGVGLVPGTTISRADFDYLKLWKEAEAYGIPIEKRPMIIQMEPTPANLRALEKRILREAGLS